MYVYNVWSCHCHIHFNTLGISGGSLTSTHTTDEHTPRSQVEDALSIGGLSGYKTKSLNVDHSGSCTWRVPHSFHVKDADVHFKTGLGWVMVFNATFSYISVISWRLVWLVEETEYPEKQATCRRSLKKRKSIVTDTNCSIFSSLPIFSCCPVSGQILLSRLSHSYLVSQ